MKYYSALKRNEPSMHAITRMNLKANMSERSQAKKSTYFYYYLYKILGNANQPIVNCSLGLGWGW